MRKIFFISVFIFLQVQILFSQSGWFWQNPLPDGNNTFGMEFFGSNNGFYANYDHICRTTNSGNNWQNIYTGFSFYITALDMVDVNTGFAILDSSILIKTSNSGINWFFVANIPPVHHPSNYYLPELKFANNTTGFILSRSQQSTVYKTTNGGINWSISVLPEPYYFSIEDIFPVTLTNIYAAGNIYINSHYITKIIKSTNSGVSWDSIFINDTDFIPTNLFFTNINTGYMAGFKYPNSKIYKTSNGGINWSLLNPNFNFIEDMQFLSVQTGYVISANIYKTTNSGSNWSTISLPYTFLNSINQVYFIDSLNGFITGDRGLVYKTVNGGMNWTKNYSNDFFYNFQTVKFSNANTGLMICNGGSQSGQILLTSNGGINWSIKDFVTSSGYTDLCYVNDFTWFVSANNNKIYKTTNFGTNWDSLTFTNVGITSLDFINVNTGFAVSKYYHFYKTINGGNNWSTLIIPSTGDCWTLDFIDENTGFIGGGKTFRTTNGGLSFEEVNLGYSLYIANIKFIDNNTGFVLGSSNILKTTNTGLTWQLTTLIYSNGSSYENITFPNASTGYILTNNFTFKTTNSGNNWFEFRTCNGHYKSSISFGDPLTGYCIGSVGSIIKTTDGGTSIGIQPISNQVPSDFRLYQNYPNPFNPISKIKFEIPKLSDTKLIVYDLLGREVMTLVNEKLNAGVYEVDFDGTNLASGIYFYRLEAVDASRLTDGQATSFSVTETRKMVLLK